MTSCDGIFVARHRRVLTAVQSVFTELLEDFAHMGLVLFWVIGINENVIKVNGDINIKKAVAEPGQAKKRNETCSTKHDFSSAKWLDATSIWLRGI